MSLNKTGTLIRDMTQMMFVTCDFLRGREGRGEPLKRSLTQEDLNLFQFLSLTDVLLRF